jgi:hypothetical protein
LEKNLWGWGKGKFICSSMQDNMANDKPETGERERKNGLKKKID